MIKNGGALYGPQVWDIVKRFLYVIENRMVRAYSSFRCERWLEVPEKP